MDKPVPLWVCILWIAVASAAAGAEIALWIQNVF